MKRWTFFKTVLEHLDPKAYAVADSKFDHRSTIAIIDLQLVVNKGRKQMEPNLS